MKVYRLLVLIEGNRFSSRRNGTLASQIILLNSQPMYRSQHSLPLAITGILRMESTPYLNPPIECLMLLISCDRVALTALVSTAGATVRLFDYVRYIFRRATMLRVLKELKFHTYSKVQQDVGVGKHNRGIQGLNTKSFLLIAYLKGYKTINSSQKMPFSFKTILDRILNNGLTILNGYSSTLTPVEDYRLHLWHIRYLLMKELSQ